MIDQHPLVFPNTLRHVLKTRDKGLIRHNLQIRVPVDDTHTQVFVVYFEPSDTERSPWDQDAPWQFVALKDKDGRYDLDYVLAQDSMAWETQGPVTDRSEEHLAVSDEGIIHFRKLLREQIEAVQKGESPLGVIRDPEKNEVINFDVINQRIGLYGSTGREPA